VWAPTLPVVSFSMALVSLSMARGRFSQR